MPSLIDRRAEPPELSDERLAQMRAHLLAAAQTPSTGRRRFFGVSRTATRRRRALVLAAAALAVTALAASAYALGRQFGLGDPAPPRVKAEVARMNASEAKGQLIPRIEHESPKAIVEDLRLGAALETFAGRVYLWVAPDTDGNECQFLQRTPNGDVGGGCGISRRRLNATVSSTRIDEHERYLRLVSGSAPPGSDAVEIYESDGDVRRIPLNGRHFLAERDARVTAVRALDARGRELDRQVFPDPATYRGREAIGPFRTLIAFRTKPRGKPVSLAVATGEQGTTCVELRAGGIGGGCNHLETLRPDELEISHTQIGSAPDGLYLLDGRVGRAVKSLELRYEDGAVEELPLVEGWTLFQVTRDHFAAGDRPDVLRARNAGGEVIARKRLGPWRK